MSTTNPGQPPKPAAKPPAAKPTARPAAAAAPAAKPVPAAKPAPAETAAARPAGEAQADEAPEEEAYVGGGSFLLFNAVPSWLTSMVFHIIVLLILAFLTVPQQDEGFNTNIVVQNNDDVEEIEEFEEEEFEKIDVTTDVVADMIPQPDTEIIQEEPILTPADDPDAAQVSVELFELGLTTAPAGDLLQTIGTYTGSGLDGRGAAARAAMVREGGGNSASEAAVAAALKWLAAHQMQDGGWNFDHRLGGPSRMNPGTARQARNGATAMALLPFLGAGQTHQDGQYRQTVRAGLNYLVRNLKPERQNLGSHWENEGRMYSHGLAAIVLTEAYAMTRDKGLMAPAQLSLNYIHYAQDPVGGGWRYSPKEPGDTSVVGWQLMALKSGHMAYLHIDPNSIRGAMRFLDAVQANSGANYGYTGPGSGQATTAIGLLCRMYLGWKHDHPALQRGVQWISNQGPSKGNMYYNYYATQVMRHYGSSPAQDAKQVWDKWNVKMRDYLIETQSKQGAEAGSWFFSSGDHGADRGGRLYCTSMATMILEVYYRHMPIYRAQAAEEEFPL